MTVEEIFADLDFMQIEGQLEKWAETRPKVNPDGRISLVERVSYTLYAPLW